MTNQNFAIVILAAGGSSRMGQPKQLLQWGEETLIEHNIKTALKVKHSEIFVVLGAYYEAIKDKISRYNVAILRNEDWKLGLGSSIALAANYIKNIEANCQGILFMLADQPFINNDYLNKMIENFQRGEFNIISTAYPDGKCGIPVLFDKVYLNDLSLLKGDSGASSIIKKNKINMQSLQVNINLSDIDTLDDYNNLLKFKQN